MKPSIATTMARADEILGELMSEYDSCLRSKAVSERAVQLTHDVCEKVRSVLDRSARQYWEKHISPNIDQEDRDRAQIYFPIAPHVQGFDSILGRWRWKSVRDQHNYIYSYLLSRQPFSDAKNGWLSVIDDLAIASKHIDLIPQTKTEHQRVTVSGAGGSISWGSGVVFGGGVRVMGAPIDPRTQRIIPTAVVTERVELWISFVIKDHNVNAAALCRDACLEARKIATEMDAEFALS